MIGQQSKLPRYVLFTDTHHTNNNILYLSATDQSVHISSYIYTNFLQTAPDVDKKIDFELRLCGNVVAIADLYTTPLKRMISVAGVVAKVCEIYNQLTTSFLNILSKTHHTLPCLIVLQYEQEQGSYNNISTTG